MPHLNGKEKAEKEDSPSKENSDEDVPEDKQGKKEKKEGANPLLSLASTASTQPKKDDSPPEASKGEEASYRWPPYPPPHAGRHSMGHPLPPPYYAYDYPGWGHPPPPGPYSRSRRSHPPSPPTRHEGEDKESPKKSSSPRSDETKEDRAARAYEEHGYPPHMHHRPPPYAYGMPPPYGYPPPHYYEEHHRMIEESRLARKRQAEKDTEKESPSSEEPPAKRAKADEEKPYDENSTDDEEKEEMTKKLDAAPKEGDEKPREEEEEAKPGDDEEEPSEGDNDKAKGDKANDERTDEKPGEKSGKKSKVGKDGKRIISPTSSLDGTHKGDDSSSPSIQYKLSQSSSGSFPPGEPRPPSSSYDPYYPPPPESYPYPPYYHPMYAGYPPPPPPGWEGYYGPPPAHYHSHDYPPPPRGYGGPHPIRGSFESAGSRSSTEGAKEGGASHTRSPAREPSPQEESKPQKKAREIVPKKIKSVSDWRAAAMATGMAPSANRCVPLQEPIPSKCWGTPEHAETIVIPDFHRLVNYPDYLIKNYPDYLRKARSKKAKQVDTQVDKNGKRHCVMCGIARLCSASSGKPTPSTRVRTPKFANAIDDEDDDESSQGGTTHIIPRQNKGLCTACDVTVWVITDSGIEIKWCKGCKNFRPWAAFGDKGMATKCVRCRERQREKYASQKDRLRAGRKSKKTPEKDEHHEIAAAKGLRDLMSASVAAV